MRVPLALLALAVLAAPSVGAQTPDSTAAPARPPSPDSTTVLAAPADSLAPVAAAVTRAAVGPFGPAPGRALSPAPATTASLDAADLVAGQAGRLGRPPRGAPAAFVYALGAPGRSGGVSLDGLAPDAFAVTLDGRPLDDPFTGAPRLDLVPLSAVGPLSLADGALGRATSLAAAVRDFRLGVPVTELRYTGLQDGVRHASGTHAQTRRPPAFLRGGSDESRLTLTLHAASRAAAAPQAGGQLRHADALGRVLLTRPGIAAEAGVLYADRTEGARAGLVSETPSVDGVFGFATAQPVDPGATRRTLRTEFWSRARVPVLARPVEAGASLALDRRVYATGAGDTTRVHGTRLSVFAEQPLSVGPHRLAVRVDGVFDGAPTAGGGSEADSLLTEGERPGAGLVASGARSGLHLTVTDSLRLGPAGLALAAGAHAVGGEAWPSASARVTAGPFTAGVRLGGRAASRLETGGLAAVAGTPDLGATRTAAADAALDLGAGDWRLGLRAFASADRDRHEVVATSDSTFAVATAESLTQGGVSASVGWREAARRGLYLRVGATARAVADAADGLRQRVDESLPRAWARARVGVRAEGVGDGVLDLDLAAVGLAWTPFRSRRVEPATGVLALPLPGGVLGAELPARGTLGLEATATFSARASLFVRYDHALGGRLYDGAVVTQGEPLAPHVLRFGVFWALLN